jgi:hypothetical protein
MPSNPKPPVSRVVVYACVVLMDCCTLPFPPLEIESDTPWEKAIQSPFAFSKQKGGLGLNL